jgi:ubiquinone/menaquinone biosynthesis C-methylase UbiE
MTETDATRGQITADAAEVYESLFVPALFQQWTEPMLDAAGVRTGDRVLDVGCGTGVLARAAAPRTGRSGAVTGLDPNDGMLTVARRVAPSLSWRAGAAEALPFDDRSFDRVLSQFVLMFVDDPSRALEEMRRVTAPGGTIALSTWAAIDETPGYAALVALIREVGVDAAADALRAPFCLGTTSMLGAIVKPVFPDVVISRREGVARFPSITAWLHTEIRGWTLSEMIDDATFSELNERAPAALRAFTDRDGAVRFPAPALIAVARV